LQDTVLTLRQIGAPQRKPTSLSLEFDLGDILAITALQNWILMDAVLVNNSVIISEIVPDILSTHIPGAE
jgi:hypothetical protein